jgi:hypothetical protein
VQRVIKELRAEATRLEKALSACLTALKALNGTANLDGGTRARRGPAKVKPTKVRRRRGREAPKISIPELKADRKAGVTIGALTRKHACSASHLYRLIKENKI